eukprot:CAMPEP_0170519726 /NCGR_PEP_ID=MMETSP0209-20121228/5034_1 /TAXON_ID=665100 ORGANISM="Litonotus pictus, Strain P1" /NCGR_SAMPLE_ID=MMETSP0209 /ASSEMBLY_ACC=CAM_ASM_000301 /LENGTH=505 /DNA_ID=CAMNT_0010805679 /DNA_START=137 /DNA_END=1654 /DNA_ORIENTATION=-
MEESVTGGKIEFAYSDRQGFHCKAKKDLFKNEFIIKVKSEYVACGYSMFPFKFELKSILDDYLDLKFKIPDMKKANKGRMSPHLFTMQLVFLTSKNRDKVLNLVQTLNKSHYLIDIKPELLEYLESLPPFVESKEHFGEDEFALFENAGIAVEKSLEVNEVHKFVVEALEKKLAWAPLLEMLKDRDNYTHWFSIVTSRSFKVNLMEYEKLFQVSLSAQPQGKQNVQLMKDMTNDYDICLIPFFDLCNHRNPENLDNKRIEFAMSFQPGKIQVALSNKFRAEEEYSYSYVPKPVNEKLLFNYGFYLDETIFSATLGRVTLMKPLITREKHNLMVKNKYIEKPFDGFFSSNHPSIVLLQPLRSDIFNKEIINVLRIYYVRNDRFKSEAVDRRLSRNQWLSYENEMLSLGGFKHFINWLHLDSAKLTLPDIVQSLVITRNFYKTNRESIQKDLKQLTKYRMRRKIMEVIRESVTTMHKNLVFADEKIQDVLSDQIVKLRNYHLEEANN